MNTTSNVEVTRKHAFMPGAIVLVLLAWILLVVGLKMVEGARLGGAEMGQTLPGGL